MSKESDPDFMQEERERINGILKEWKEAEKTKPPLTFFLRLTKMETIKDEKTGDEHKVEKTIGYKPNIDAFVEAIRSKFHPVNTGGNYKGILFKYENGVFSHKDVEIDINREFNRIWKDNRPKGRHIEKYTPSKDRDEFFKRLRMAKFFKSTKFDQEPNLLNCKNGFVFLDIEDGNHWLLSHDKHTPYDYPCVKQFNVEFDENALHPIWQKFLDYIMPDTEKQKQLQEVAGFLLFHRYSIEKAMLLIGDGRNGKDTFVRVLTEICGGEDNITNTTFKEMDTNRFALFNLVGKFANIISEGSKSIFKHSERLKQVTGNSPITVEQKMRDAISIYNSAKIIIIMNEYPIVTDHTRAFWERWVVINFDRYIQPDERIPDYYIELLKEQSGILNWMIEGYLRLKERTQFTIQDDAKMKWRRQEDIYLAFTEEVLLVTQNPYDTIATKKAYETFTLWIAEKNLRLPSENTFSRNIYRPAYGHKKIRPGGGGTPYHIAHFDDTKGVAIDYEWELRRKGQEVVYTKDPDSLSLQ